MSTQHRPADRPTHSPSEYRTRAASRIAPPVTEPPTDLADQLERARLRMRVAALERSLAESERRRQAIVDQYELILADHERDDFNANDPDTDDPHSDGSRTDRQRPTSRLRRLVPVVG